ncbi:TPA: hypothetical protein ACGRQV_002243 [Pseudomonas aeruginosa]
MSSIQLIEQCVTRLRGIIEALDNIHDTSPHRWSTDLDDVHSSAESLLAMIKDQAPALDAQGLAGDGSLRHPCPAHIGPFDKLVGSPVHNESEPDLPPLDEHLAQVFETGMALSESVEQAGGDEREEFLAWACKEYGIEDKYDLNENHHSIRENKKGWMARAALAIASSAQTEHERDMLGQALGECIEAAGITTPGTPLTGPQLLMFAKDLKRDLKRAALAQPSPASDLDPLNLAPHAKAFNEAPAEALKPEQAEANLRAMFEETNKGKFPRRSFERDKFGDYVDRSAEFAWKSLLSTLSHAERLQALEHLRLRIDAHMFIREDGELLGYGVTVPEMREFRELLIPFNGEIKIK